MESLKVFIIVVYLVVWEKKIEDIDDVIDNEFKFDMFNEFVKVNKDKKYINF